MFSKKFVQGILVVLTYQFLSIQGEIDIIGEDILVPFYNEKYCSEPDIYINENNKIFFNFTILQQWPEDTKLHFTVLAASMGEYIIQTGIDQEISLCDMIEEPIIVGPFIKMLGFSETDCPPSVGIYGTQERKIPWDLMPDVFPPNKYLSIIDIFSKEEQIILSSYLCYCPVKLL